MIVEAVFNNNPHSIKIPSACCKCGNLSFPAYWDTVEAGDNPSATRIFNWLFRFPYCQTCAKELKSKLFFKGSAKGVSVHKAWVRTKKIGSFLRKKKIRYIPFKFTNERYGQLFRDANKEILLEKAIAMLQTLQCSQCGEEIPQMATFCPSCGKKQK